MLTAFYYQICIIYLVFYLIYNCRYMGGDVIMKSLVEKFEALDILADSLSKNANNFYFLLKVVDNLHYKKYEIQYPLENKLEKEEYIKKVNEITSSPDFISELAAFTKNNEFPTEKLETTGYIECKYTINQIDINVVFENETIKTFSFRDQEYFDSFINYMEKEVRELVYDKLVNE